MRHHSVKACAKINLGLLITGLAISHGSSLWFDMLGKLVNLRSSGTAGAGALHFYHPPMAQVEGGGWRGIPRSTPAAMGMSTWARCSSTGVQGAVCSKGHAALPLHAAGGRDGQLGWSSKLIC